MARYEDDFMGIPARFGRPTGMDPNFDGGYRGMRNGPWGGQAAYGSYRAMRRADLESWGGAGGIHGQPRGSGRALPLEGGGGVRDPFHDAEFRRGFNSRAEHGMPAPRPGDYDREMERRSQRMIRPEWMPKTDFHGRYSDRGTTPSGFSEGWARGPMRGSR